MQCGDCPLGIQYKDVMSEEIVSVGCHFDRYMALVNKECRIFANDNPSEIIMFIDWWRQNSDKYIEMMWKNKSEYKTRY